MLAAGDLLGFTLRVNAVIARSAAPGQRGQRHDVVMDALYGVPSGERASKRLDTVMQAGRAWLARQGEAHGFLPEPGVEVDGYDRVQIDRERGAPAVFGVVEFTGLLRVQDPVRLVRGG